MGRPKRQKDPQLEQLVYPRKHSTRSLSYHQHIIPSYPAHQQNICAGKSTISTYLQQNCVLFKHPLFKSKAGTIWCTIQFYFSPKKQYATLKKISHCSGWSKGGARDPPRPNSFNFMHFLGNFGKIVCWRPPPPPRGSWRPLLEKILDPPLHWYKKNSTNQYPSGKWFYLPVTTTGTVAVLQSSRFADTSSNSSWSPRFLTSVSKSLLYHRRAYLIIYHHQLFNVNISLIRPNIQFNSYMH